jgi:threonine dehydrogenase-like Zn-dependent dehydrogenase
MFLAMNTTSSLMMQGVVYNGIPHQVSVAKLPIPTLEADTDAIVRIKIAGICGTDLHMYHGFRGQDAPWVMGHEALGYIEEKGSGVSSLEVGDYVVIPDNVDSGHLEMEPSAFEVFGVGRGLGGLQGESEIPMI